MYTILPFCLYVCQKQLIFWEVFQSIGYILRVKYGPMKKTSPITKNLN